MEKPLVRRRITTLVTGALFCLSASNYCLVRGAKPDPPPVDGSAVSPAPQAAAQTCTDSPLELQLQGDEGSFEFKCGPGLKLHPVEKEEALLKTPTQEQLEKVYVFTPTPAAEPETPDSPPPTCEEKTKTLTGLVPGSSLELVKKANKKAGQQAAAAEPEFRLTLVAPTNTDQHFCYFCSPSEPTVIGREKKGCTIYVTAPKKAEHSPPPKPEPPTDEQGDQQESGSLSPSVSCWLIFSAAACAAGLIIQL